MIAAYSGSPKKRKGCLIVSKIDKFGYTGDLSVLDEDEIAVRVNDFETQLLKELV